MHTGYLQKRATRNLSEPCGGCGGCGCGGCGSDVEHDTCLCRYEPSRLHLIGVAEHLRASSRRHRHPFPALMAGVNPGRVSVHTALKTTSRQHLSLHHDRHVTILVQELLLHVWTRAVWHNNGHAHILVQEDWTCGTP